jgi:hypothetical protein
MGLRRFSGNVVFFPDRVILSKIPEDHGQEFGGDPIGIGFITVSAQPFDGHEVNGSPSIWIIPLRLRHFPTHCQAARLFKQDEIFRDGLGLFVRGQARP